MLKIEQFLILIIKNTLNLFYAQSFITTGMKIKIHAINNIKFAEVISDERMINSAEDGLDLLGNLYYEDFDSVIIHEKNITADFFDLRNGMAGEILQKFSNYRVRLAIVGDISRFSAKSMKDFIFESNKYGHVNFVNNVSEAIAKLSKT